MPVLAYFVSDKYFDFVTRHNYTVHMTSGDPRFDVNVTVKSYIQENVNTVGGIIMAK